ncbi:c-type cytochrome [Algoriphagus sp.]|uniref:c-type cytochrome n=1 Tax=Algoriphagus sp. TaxID=1872435 RepID=UPI00391A5DAA
MKKSASLILAFIGGLTLTAHAQQVENGLVLLQKHCYSCHNPNTASHDEILAPPLFGIKNNYRNTFPEKDKFIDAMVGFINSPSEEKALMKGPIKRFGLMPKPAVSPEAIKLIVSYIEANEIQKPTWYDAHHGK